MSKIILHSFFAMTVSLICGCKIWSYSTLAQQQNSDLNPQLQGTYSIRSFKIKEPNGEIHDAGKLKKEITDIVSNLKPGLLSDNGIPVDMLVVNYLVNNELYPNSGLDVIITVGKNRSYTCMYTFLLQHTLPRDTPIIAKRLTTWYGPWLDLACIVAYICDKQPLWNESVARGFIIALARNNALQSDL
jgi:hypothetical protein